MKISKIISRFDNIISVRMHDPKTVCIQGSHENKDVECELLTFAYSFEAETVYQKLSSKIKEINSLLDDKKFRSKFHDLYQ